MRTILLLFVAWGVLNNSFASTVWAQKPALNGTVVDADGKPVEGAFVSVIYYTIASYDLRSSVRTAADGGYSVAAPTTQPLAQMPDSLLADIPGVGVTRPESLGGDLGGQLRLSPSVPLHLSLTAPDGAPAAGVAVRPVMILWQGSVISPGGVADLPPEMSRRWEKTTGADGTVVFLGLPDDSRVRFEVGNDRYANPEAANEDVHIGRDATSARISLRPGFEISGTVTYADTGKPAAGAKLIAQAANGDAQGGGIALTDAAGHYQIKHLAAARYAVTISLATSDRDSQWVGAAAVVDLHGQSDDHADISLVRGGFVTGKVRDAETGLGIAGAHIGIYGPAHPKIAASVQGDTTDADGTYRIRVAPGSQYVYVSSGTPPGYLTPAPKNPPAFRPLGGSFGERPNETVDVGEGQTVAVNFDFPKDKTPAVTGRVIDPDGNPVAGAAVTYDSPPSGGQMSLPFDNAIQTDATGRFTIHVRAGTRLRARYKDMATENAVNVTAPGGFYTLQLSANMNFALTVNVADETGAPVGGASVRMMPQTNSGFSFASSDDDKKSDAKGVVIYDALASDEKWRVMAQADGYGVTQATAPAPAHTLPRKASVSITLKKADQVISGTAVDEKGNPVAGAKVVLNGSLTGTIYATTDANGQFKFAVVAGASGVVYLQRESGHPPPRTLTRAQAGMSDIKLVKAGPATRP